MAARLGSASELAAGVVTPGYEPDRHGVGMAHIGLGAFHRAHQAVYTDAALATAGGDWRSVGISLRSTQAVTELNAQQGRYAVLERGGQEVQARVIGSIARAIAARDNPAGVIEVLADPGVHIVSLTVTEKAYGIARDKDSVTLAHPPAGSLQEPQGVLGFLVAALALRRERTIEPFTVLCCDNVPDNGGFLRAGTIAHAGMMDARLAGWIEEHVAFPATMVDRITPAPTPDTLADARRLLGVDDLMAVETEPFSQWVIEDDFPAGRPAWEAGGAVFVDDVAPYERMKLRMLNGAHSMLAYAGFLAGHACVRDVMADRHASKLVERYLQAAALTLEPLVQTSFAEYAADLVARFANPAIAHETYQIAMDGSQKLPLRILAPAVDALKREQSLRPYAFATAAWMRYCLGRHDDGRTFALRDPLEAQIAARVEGLTEAAQITARLHDLDGVFPDELRAAPQWRQEVTDILAAMIEQGMPAALKQEAQRSDA